MTCLVVGCNHWIGYYIVNELLAHDYQVDGIEDEQGKELLSLYFGRNSSFTFVSANVKKHYDTVIFPDKKQTLQHVQTDRTISIGSGNESIKKSSNSIYIQTPILFGEWMPMNEKGFYHQRQTIAFDSEQLITNGVYIKDFTKGLIQWMKTTQMPAELVVRSIRQKNKGNDKLGNSIYIRDQLSVEENIKKVREHYERYKAMY